LPETLNELVPEFLSSAPLDPVDGAPFHYRKEGEKDFMLWSIGWNDKDDDGLVCRSDKTKGDWTWASRPALYRVVP
jgi:hypothetical protein